MCQSISKVNDKQLKVKVLIMQGIVVSIFMLFYLLFLKIIFCYDLINKTATLKCSQPFLAADVLVLVFSNDLSLSASVIHAANNQANI